MNISVIGSVRPYQGIVTVDAAVRISDVAHLWVIAASGFRIPIIDMEPLEGIEPPTIRLQGGSATGLRQSGLALSIVPLLLIFWHARGLRTVWYSGPQTLFLAHGGRVGRRDNRFKGRGLPPLPGVFSRTRPARAWRCRPFRNRRCWHRPGGRPCGRTSRPPRPRSCRWSA